MKIRKKEGVTYESPTIQIEKICGHEAFTDVEIGCRFFKEYGWREEEPVWHDLRKNPDDLPSDDRDVLCYIKGERCNGYRVDYYIEDMDLEWAHDVLAWREIPKFEEK